MRGEQGGGARVGLAWAALVVLICCLLPSVGAFGTRSCPSGWVMSLTSGQTYCYWFSSSSETTRTYQSARNHCRSFGGGADLVSIANSAEMNFVWPRAAGRFWLGLTDIASEGTFVWSDGSSSSYRYWYSGEPNNYGGAEDCTESYTSRSGRWNDLRCDSPRHWVCKVRQG